MTAYVFDLDGTLTPNGQVIDKEFGQWFYNNFQWHHETFLVTGTEFSSVEQQLPGALTLGFQQIHTCCGNEVRELGILRYQSSWKAPKKLINELKLILDQSPFYLRTGEHIMQRTGMVSFSTVGRNATPEQRQEYKEWDAKAGERLSIRARLLAAFPNMDFTIAGDLGIDMYPIGKGKQQALKWIKATTGDEPIVFFGDKTKPGGNDYSLAVLADLTHQVEDWQHTWDLLRIINLQ